MRRRLPSLNALRTFEAAARLGSLTRAADELAVTQGAVSRQIRTLEEDVGVALFRRVHRGVVLSPEGQALSTVLREAMDRIADGVDRIRGDPLLVRVRVPPTFGVRWLWPRLSGFEAAHPGVRLQINVLWHNIGPDDRDFDVGVRLDRSGASADATPLFGERMVPVCAPRFLDRHARPTTAAEFGRAPLLHCPASRADWRYWAHHWSGGPFDVDRGEVFDMLDLALRAAEAGRGIAVADIAMIGADLALGRLVLASDEVIANGQVYSLVLRDPSPLRPAVLRFRDWLLGEARSQG